MTRMIALWPFTAFLAFLGCHQTTNNDFNRDAQPPAGSNAEYLKSLQVTTVGQILARPQDFGDVRISGNITDIQAAAILSNQAGLTDSSGRILIGTNAPATWPYGRMDVKVGEAVEVVGLVKQLESGVMVEVYSVFKNNMELYYRGPGLAPWDPVTDGNPPVGTPNPSSDLTSRGGSCLGVACPVSP